MVRKNGDGTVVGAGAGAVGKGTALVRADRGSVRGGAPVPVVLPPGGAVVRDRGTTLIAGRAYDAHGVIVPTSEIYHVKDAKPRGDGPWLGEADKISWRDPVTEYECIVMRARPGAHLCGYVGVPRSHPLHGFAPDAIPADLGIEVHGGITYGRMCQGGPTPRRLVVYEARRICHVAVAVGVVGVLHGSDHRVADAHAWWFGFECDHVADVVPNDAGHRAEAAKLGVAQTYRDDAYLYREVTDLAAQLHAVHQKRPVPPRSGPPLPPATFGPDRAS